VKDDEWDFLIKAAKEGDHHLGRELLYHAAALIKSNMELQ